jgi:hypothetical protein
VRVGVERGWRGVERDGEGCRGVERREGAEGWRGERVERGGEARGVGSPLLM